MSGNEAGKKQTRTPNTRGVFQWTPVPPIMVPATNVQNAALALWMNFKWMHPFTPAAGLSFFTRALARCMLLISTPPVPFRVTSDCPPLRRRSSSLDPLTVTHMGRHPHASRQHFLISSSLALATHLSVSFSHRAHSHHIPCYVLHCFTDMRRRLLTAP